MEKIARGHGREANIARGEAECYFYHIALVAVL